DVGVELVEPDRVPGTCVPGDGPRAESDDADPERLAIAGGAESLEDPRDAGGGPVVRAQYAPALLRPETRAVLDASVSEHAPIRQVDHSQRAEEAPPPLDDGAIA